MLLGIELSDGVGGAELIVVGIVYGFLVYHIDLAFQGIFRTDGDENADGIGTEFLFDLGNDFIEVGSGAIHLVNEDDTRDIVFGGLAPDGFGLWLDASDTAENDDCAIKHSE